MSAEVPKHSIEEYLMFFRHCTKRLQEEIPKCYPAERFAPQKSIIPTSAQDNLAALSSFRLNPTGAAIGLLLREMQMIWKCTRMPDAHSAEFDAWWKARFQGLAASSTALKILFDGWDSWVVHASEETHKFTVQTIKAINAQAIEDPSLTRNIGGQSVQVGEVIVTFVIATGDLELPSGEEEDETLAEQPPVEATPSARRKRKETALAQASSAQREVKKLRKRIEVESDEIEEPAAVPTETSRIDDKLREAFEAVEQEKEKEREKEGDVPSKNEKEKDLEEEEEIPTKVIVESIALAQKQQEIPRAELTSSELALFEDVEAEHSTAVLASEKQAELFASELVERTELPVAILRFGVG
ncbi:unnamed protein product [Prunus armeniaca]